jgi:hypothetical protein
MAEKMKSNKIIRKETKQNKNQMAFCLCLGGNSTTGYIITSNGLKVLDPLFT